MAACCEVKKSTIKTVKVVVKESKEIEITCEDDIVDVGVIGKIKVTVLNRGWKGGCAFAVHGRSIHVKDEWIHFGKYLCEAFNLAVYVPNFHSNDKTAPGRKGYLDILSNGIDASRYLIEKHYKLNNVLLCGKGYGSMVVGRLASTADWFKATILANNMNKEHLEDIHKKNKPLLFLTSTDDWRGLETMHLYGKEWKNDKKFRYFVGPANSPSVLNSKFQGGHSMTESFIDPIVDFTETFYMK